MFEKKEAFSHLYEQGRRTIYKLIDISTLIYLYILYIYIYCSWESSQNFGQHTAFISAAPCKLVSSVPATLTLYFFPQVLGSQVVIYRSLQLAIIYFGNLAQTHFCLFRCIFLSLLSSQRLKVMLTTCTKSTSVIPLMSPAVYSFKDMS